MSRRVSVGSLVQVGFELAGYVFASALERGGYARVRKEARVR